MPWMHNQLDTRKVNSTQIQRKRKELELYILQENAWNNNNKSHKTQTQPITTHKQQTQTKPRHKHNQNTNDFSQMSPPTNQTIEKHLFWESLQNTLFFYQCFTLGNA
jgi:hypothetical protein